MAVFIRRRECCVSFSPRRGGERGGSPATITSHPYVNGRKSFNTALTPGGALYFHELIVEARNSAFCGTRVAWCILSSKTYLPRRLRATFHNAPGMFPTGPVTPPGNQNEGEDTVPLRAAIGAPSISPPRALSLSPPPSLPPCHSSSFPLTLSLTFQPPTPVSRLDDFAVPRARTLREPPEHKSLRARLYARVRASFYDSVRIDVFRFSRNKQQPNCSYRGTASSSPPLPPTPSRRIRPLLN